MTNNHLCYCQSNRSFARCCEPFLLKTATPKTPEQLMRSRYSAFVTHNVDYLEETMLSPALDTFNKSETLDWTMSVRWEGLEIIASSSDDDMGYVSFVASYVENGSKETMSETSTFKKQDDRWFYITGVSLDG